mmetsp:Transcript_43286/g.169442  ORF Transcript_43286/g.169442 Transcript_43286/m.169442 type:complete len:98 (-) Transcript_43286:1594-1887(-)
MVDDRKLPWEVAASVSAALSMRTIAEVTAQDETNPSSKLDTLMLSVEDHRRSPEHEVVLTNLADHARHFFNQNFRPARLSQEASARFEAGGSATNST